MKAGLIIYEELTSKYRYDEIGNKVNRDIKNFIEAGVEKFYIIIPEKSRYPVINMIIEKFSKSNIEIIFRELYGDDGGGGIVSLIPFIHHGEKIIVMNPAFEYSKYLYKYFVDLANREEYPILFISQDNQSPFTALYRDRVIFLSDVKNKIAKYSYIGTAILNYLFFSKISELMTIYPDLHTMDIGRIYNLYLSKGGILKAEYLSPYEWKLKFLI